MALIPVGKVTLTYPGQLSFKFEDVTEDYSDSNLGGYGSPNIERSAVTVTQLFITPPGGDAETEITGFDYLPTDDDPFTVDCTMYSPEEEEDEEEDDNDCADCPDLVAEDECEPEDATCFGDGCWTFRYVVKGALGVTVADVTFKVFFYGITRKRIADLAHTNLLKNGCCNDDPRRDAINMVKNDFDGEIFTASTKSCDCDCVTGGLASIQKRLTQLENTV